MPKLVRATALLVALFALSVPATVGVAQDSKKTTKEKAKEKAKPGAIVVSEGKDGKFRFQIRDADDKYIAGSAAFKTKEEATDAVDTLKDILSVTKVTYGKKNEDEPKKKKG